MKEIPKQLFAMYGGNDYLQARETKKGLFEETNGELNENSLK